jgi:adenylate cyclase class 2
MIVPSLKEGNDLLEALGFAHRTYQEKKRVTYLLGDHEIDIDTWPGIPTYFEVEGKDKQDIEEILNKLGYNWEEAISCTADDIYIKYGKISPSDLRELKFEENN